MSWAQKFGDLSLRIGTLADRDRHRCVVDVPEIRIVSFVGRSDLTAVSGSEDHRPDPAPDASGSSE